MGISKEDKRSRKKYLSAISFAYFFAGIGLGMVVCPKTLLIPSIGVVMAVSFYLIARKLTNWFVNNFNLEISKKEITNIPSTTWKPYRGAYKAAFECGHKTLGGDEYGKTKS